MPACWELSAEQELGCKSLSQLCCSSYVLCCLSVWVQYAALATQIGTIQQAEAPRRVLKAISPAIRKMKRKAGLPPEARGGKGGWVLP